MTKSYIVVYSRDIFPRVSSIEIVNEGYEKSGWTFEEAREEVLRWVEEKKEEIISMTEEDVE
jgi:hypothetical protein